LHNECGVLLDGSLKYRKKEKDENKEKTDGDVR